MVSLKHREVLLKSLQSSQVSKDTTPKQLTNLVAAVRASTALSFSDQDLTPEGKNHSKPLLVTVLCNQKKVPAVFMDNGSALNICPLSTATTNGFGPSDFFPSDQGIGLGRYQQGVAQFDDLQFPTNVGTTGLVYQNTYREEQEMYRSITQRRLYKETGEVMSLPEIKLTLNGHFCKEGEDFPYCDEDADETSLEIKNLIKRGEEHRAKPLEDEFETISIGIESLLQEIKISKTLSSEEHAELIKLLKEFKEVFTWSYEDMPGLSEKIVQYHIPLFPEAKPKKQKLKRMKPEWVLKIKDKVINQLKAGFLEVVTYPEWLANIVLVPKKDGRVRCCFNFRDLNKAGPKDDFYLPHNEILVDNMADHALLSFMDDFSGYNQIKMAPEDKTKIAFTTQFGTYCYRMMPFSLKNAGATYQRATTTFLHDLIHKEVDVYVDDMIVNAKTRADHIQTLRRFFERIAKYKLRLNPNNHRGIKVDPAKVKAIQEMLSPKTEKEIRGFLGKVQHLSGFITQLTSTCEPIFKLLKKNASKQWNLECQQACEKIKDCLSSPPVLTPAVAGRPFLLYLSNTDTSLGCMLAQEDPETRREMQVYYLSKKMLEYELNYTQLERTSLPLKSVKARIAIKQLADAPTEDTELSREFPDEGIMTNIVAPSDSTWTMHFDGESNSSGRGVGIVLLSPRDEYIPIFIKLEFECTNNMDEYEACIAGLEAALSLEVQDLDVYEDSLLIICQTNGKWLTKEHRLIPYHTYLTSLMKSFHNISFTYISKLRNRFADALATLASMVDIPV
ncbi:uncharacterized protein LOC143861474 [Tasmannia lanceolata]|uniref:uncharacterized protein LOC143861474 n=1 Tax=Tasmannia lanceolata TaxID=3420 RepID=UPI00406460A5